MWQQLPVAVGWCHPAGWDSSPLDQPVSSPGDGSLRPGTLKQWQLTLYGSAWSPAEMKERQRWDTTALSWWGDH